MLENLDFPYLTQFFSKNTTAFTLGEILKSLFVENH